MKLPPRVYVLSDRLRESLLTLHLSMPRWPTGTTVGRRDGVVIGMTSYPARINEAWKAIETLLRQDGAGIPVVLVLSEDEFPGRIIPRRLHNQTKRGLQILWTDTNGRSFDKLLPVRKAFPNATIITVDDDKYFPRTLVCKLLDAHALNPGHIIGARGWRVLPDTHTGEVHFGTGWIRSEPGDTGSGLHVPGGNGCLYPPGSLDSVVDDLDLAQRLCPTTDDIWFWVAAHRAGTPVYCLGLPAHRPIGSQRDTPALSDVNSQREQEQFQSVLQHFGITATDLAWQQSPQAKKK